MKIVASHGLTDWLQASNVSLAFSTYRMGKIFFLGRKPEGQLSVFERTFNRSMGIWTDSQTLWLASAFQVWRFENMLPSGHTEKGFDRLFVPQESRTTGDINVHDITVSDSSELFFASTLFSCVGQLDVRHSLRAVWRPQFISELVPEDRCHLNGLCCVDGRIRYVTVCGRTDTDHGWRAQKRDGGCVIDIESDEVIVEGLSMPHSPRFVDGKLWVLNSGRGEFGYVDTSSGKFHPLVFCPGFARGLAICGRYAIVGLSKPRDKTFAGLELDALLEKHQTAAICGLVVIDRERCEIVHQLHVLGEVEELYDVAALPGVKCPKAFGLKTNETRHNVWLHEGEKTTRFTASESN